MPVEVELDIFSGRPNPRWLLEPRLEAELFKEIKALPLASRDISADPPGLGYRGFVLRTGDEKTIGIYKGMVKIGDEIRIDQAQKLEKWLLETAASLDPHLLDAVKRELSFKKRCP